MKELQVPLLTVALLVFAATISPAQTPAESRRIGWYLAVHGGDFGRDMAPRTFRLYDEVEEIRLRLSITNEFDTPLFVDQPTLQRSLGVVIVSPGGGVDAKVEWPSSIRLVGGANQDPLVLAPNDSVRIDEEQAATWIVGLRRADGEPFVGTFEIRVAMQPAFAAFRNADGEPWVGPSMASEGDVTVVVNRPRSDRERLQQAMTDGRFAAWEEGNWSAAAAAWGRAVGLDPNSYEAKSSLATAYLQLKRYREAIPLFEEILAQNPANRLDAPGLVHAYVGVGDEASAARVLQAHGLNGQQVANRIAEVREGLRRSR